MSSRVIQWLLVIGTVSDDKEINDMNNFWLHKWLKMWVISSIVSKFSVFSIDASAIPFPITTESRNIFYEEELLKKEREIHELR